VGITRFPIYFFCDEAVHAVSGMWLLRDGWRDHTGTFLPPYFINSDKYNLGLSVYIHLLTAWTFGKSVLVARATSAIISVAGVLCLALLLKFAYRIRGWWLAPLVLGAIPAWFLHSRTAFEVILSASFYAGFIMYYVLYRTRDVRYAYPALLAGAATFYSYTNGQGVMFVTAVLLFLSDIRYHLKVPARHLWGIIALGLVLAVPYARFMMIHPDANSWHLWHLRSYWTTDLPLPQKLNTFLATYLHGLDPRYWFLHHEEDIVRHRMYGMAYIPLVFAPLVAAGLVRCLIRFRESSYRIVPIAFLATPFSAALIDIDVNRVLTIVVPVTICVCLAGDWLLSALRSERARAIALGLAALLLATGSIMMLTVALRDGGTWYRNYGMYGMQWGASQLYGAIREELARTPGIRIYVSPSWANNGDVFEEFFLTPQEMSRVEIRHVDYYLIRRQELDPRDIQIFSPEEFRKAREDGRLLLEEPLRVIRAPDGTDAFVFVRMRYAAGADAAFAREREERARLRDAQVRVSGMDMTISHSMLGMGEIRDVVDGDTRTLIRGFEANPFVMEFRFPQSRAINALNLELGTMERFTVTLSATDSAGGIRKTVRAFEGLPPDPRVSIESPVTESITGLRLEIYQMHGLDTAEIHVREVEIE
jgi:hypothetical protein